MASRQTGAAPKRKTGGANGPSRGDQLRASFTWLVLLSAIGLIGFIFLRNAGSWADIMSPLPTVQTPQLGAPAAPLAPKQASAPGDAAEQDNEPGQNSGAGRIGIVSGHRGNDSGAICKDGLTEASLNFDHATRAANLLRAEGYSVDILDEKDQRLKNYEALAFVSIHADSCAPINDLATGYKVARSIHSALPKIEDQLVDCLSKRYAAATGLRFHRNTVTHNMTEYHGFYKIHPKTPSAIIETGFMFEDRDVLTQKADVVARGIADGILCFLREETP